MLRKNGEGIRRLFMGSEKRGVRKKPLWEFEKKVSD